MEIKEDGKSTSVLLLMVQRAMEQNMLVLINYKIGQNL